MPHAQYRYTSNETWYDWPSRLTKSPNHSCHRFIFSGWRVRVHIRFVKFFPGVRRHGKLFYILSEYTPFIASDHNPATAWSFPCPTLSTFVFVHHLLSLLHRHSHLKLPQEALYILHNIYITKEISKQEILDIMHCPIHESQGSRAIFN